MIILLQVSANNNTRKKLPPKMYFYFLTLKYYRCKTKKVVNRCSSAV